MSVPLVYMWVVYFKDGRAMSQFDPETGNENLYKEAMNYPAQIVKVGLYPISLSMTQKIKGAPVRCKEYLPVHEVDIPAGAIPVVLRRNYIDYTLTGGIGLKGRRLWYIIGSQQNDEHDLRFIDENGHCEHTDNFEFR